MGTYVEVFKVARHQEQAIRRRKAEMRMQKYLAGQIFGVSSSKVPLAKRQITSTVRLVIIYVYCQLLKHIQSNYKRAHWLCLSCGVVDHQIGACTQRKFFVGQRQAGKTQKPL